MKTGWSIPIEKLAEKAMLDVETVVRDTTFKLFDSVQALSPVAYPPSWKHPVKGYVGGRFRGNWFPSPGLILRVVNLEAKSTDSADRIRRVYEFPVGGIVYLSNSLPYAERLENGWSKQAPTGMVRKSALMFRRFVRQSIK